MVIEDTKLSSLELAQEMFHREHKHFPHYIPLVIVGVILTMGFLFYEVSLQATPQVAGTSTENVSVDK